ncbi:MAG: hypothetical protein JZU50_01925 [Desulfobulbaceae bacterium]|nr:hypothetical protein [Desulfobulbaceae bacterium]
MDNGLFLLFLFISGPFHYLLMIHHLKTDREIKGIFRDGQAILQRLEYFFGPIEALRLHLIKGLIIHPREGYMRFRITKNNEGSIYSMIVSGEIDDDAGWDVLQIAQTMLNMPHCTELIIDLRSAMIDEDVTIFNTDTLVSVFEEGLLRKDSTLVIRCFDDHEIRLSSDQQLLETPEKFTNVGINEAKFYGRVMKWLEKEARFMIN